MSSTLFARLARDTRGNMLALIAAMMMPLIGLIGGGVDMSRLYLTRARLQQACDAGALAGRKAMGGGAWTTGTNGSLSKANGMFAANFREGDYGSGALTNGFTESEGVVTGTANVSIPMTLMRVFGITEKSVAVTCSAKMAIPNTDVMFVLDVTGSMNCVAGDASCSNNGNVPAPGSKINGLRSAVKCFYETLLKVNTSEVCTSNDPTATTASTTAQIRIGFMPYSVNVNVGKLLPQGVLADSWAYQTRVPVFYTGTTTTWETYGSSIAQDDCTKYMANQSFYGFSPSATTLGGGTYDRVSVTFPTDGSATSGGSSGEWGWSGAPDTSGSTRSCRRLRTETVSQVNTKRLLKYWTYTQAALDVSGLKKSGGSGWNNAVSLPLGSDGSGTDVNWDGCIEEAQTFRNTDGTTSDDWSPIPSTALDMDINLVPSAGKAGSQWGPMLEGAVWGRYEGSNARSNYTLSDVNTTADLSRVASYSCPIEASRLRVYNTSNDLETYVDSLTGIGNTYHDIGLLWGARFISPVGIFAANNAKTSSGGEIQRHIIYMTDGDARSFDTDYSAYGTAYWDRRQKTGTPDNAPTGYYNDDNQYNQMINARLVALCDSVKNMNITLWVISYGGGLKPATETRLRNCATSGHYFAAADNATLVSRFQSIAAAISELRLTQ